MLIPSALSLRRYLATLDIQWHCAGNMLYYVGSSYSACNPPYQVGNPSTLHHLAPVAWVCGGKRFILQCICSTADYLQDPGEPISTNFCRNLWIWFRPVRNDSTKIFPIKFPTVYTQCELLWRAIRFIACVVRKVPKIFIMPPGFWASTSNWFPVQNLIICATCKSDYDIVLEILY